jgi:hypothetical protein
MWSKQGGDEARVWAQGIYGGGEETEVLMSGWAVNESTAGLWSG